MKVILVFVSTLNGKITRGDDPEVRHWSSESDKEHYMQIWKESSLVIMGSNTYNDNIITPSPRRLILVMTRNPEKYNDRSIKGQVEFTNESPLGIVERYKSRFDLMTVVGGSKIASSFLKDSIIDELILTIEPIIFGQGIDLLSGGEYEVRLKLLDIKRSNENGTLITRYKILK
ncbi:MAG TPA: dihydrofolate reductase family protein [Bacteroidales bacterium]|nr:dihydrofolate reductase family protein [Bacteroidales bacterium]